MCGHLSANTNLSKPAAVGTVGTGGNAVTDVAVGLDTACLLEALSDVVVTGATAAAGATIGPPLAASVAAVLCCVTAGPCKPHLIINTDQNSSGYPLSAACSTAGT